VQIGVRYLEASNSTGNESLPVSNHLRGYLLTLGNGSYFLREASFSPAALFTAQCQSKLFQTPHHYSLTGHCLLYAYIPKGHATQLDYFHYNLYVFPKNIVVF
jgi:hypothetical protein